MATGNRVFLKKPETDKKLIEAFSKIPAANIADAMNRLCAMNPRIHLMSSPETSIVAGPALTVKTRGGDNLMIHQALDIAQEGDFIVVSNEEDTNRALMGEIMFTYANYRKLGAIIVDGPVRDTDAAANMKLPIYATGSTPGGPYKEGPGEVNVPIACGGINVEPGDIIVADHDGVIVIPFRDAPAILEAAQALSANDEKKVQAAATGNAKRGWVMEKLIAKGTEILDQSYYGEKN